MSNRSCLPALVATTGVPLSIAAAFVYAARHWHADESDSWLLVLAIFPLELLRVLGLRLLADALDRTDGVWAALRYFLVSVALCLGVMLLAAIPAFGFRRTARFVEDPLTWEVVAAVLALVAFDGSLVLRWFPGDQATKSARLEAASADNNDLAGLAFFPGLFIVAFGAFTLLMLQQYGVFELRWLDPTHDSWRRFTYYVVAGYFVAKAGLFAWVQTRAFERSGRRLLAWAVNIGFRDKARRLERRRNEQQAAAFRRAAMAGYRRQ